MADSANMPPPSFPHHTQSLSMMINSLDEADDVAEL